LRGRLASGIRHRVFDAVLAVQLASDAELGRAVLRELASDKNTPPSVRAQAAFRLVSVYGEHGPMRDIAARLEAVEAAQGVDRRTGWKAA
jgi:hypothetical protein